MLTLRKICFKVGQKAMRKKQKCSKIFGQTEIDLESIISEIQDLCIFGGEDFCDHITNIEKNNTKYFFSTNGFIFEIQKQDIFNTYEGKNKIFVHVYELDGSFIKSEHQSTETIGWFSLRMHKYNYNASVYELSSKPKFLLKPNSIHKNVISGELNMPKASLG